MICIECGKTCSGKKCMACFKKSQQFKVGELTFDNKSDLNRIIKQKIKELPRNLEFEDKLLSTIINELHDEVRKRNFKVIKFKILDWWGQEGRWEFCRERFRGGIFVIGFFEPINEWHGVTLYPHKRGKNNVRKNLIDTLRQKWSEQAKVREPFAKCENCNNLKPQLHHDNISFKEIVEKCLSFFSKKELEEGVGDDWWLHEQETDVIPNNHPAVQEMLRLHNKVKYRWLCYGCHKE